MAFQRATVVDPDDGAKYHLRELTAGAVEAIASVEGDYQQALAVLAFSLCDGEGHQKWDPNGSVPAALDDVRDLPARLVRDLLVPAASDLNGMDDDPGNG